MKEERNAYRETFKEFISIKQTGDKNEIEWLPARFLDNDNRMQTEYEDEFSQNRHGQSMGSSREYETNPNMLRAILPGWMTRPNWEKRYILKVRSFPVASQS